MFVQALLAQSAIETLHHGVIGWLAWPAEVQLDSPLISPLIHDLADELTAIIGFDSLWLAAFVHDSIEYTYNIFPFEALPNMDRLTFS